MLTAQLSFIISYGHVDYYFGEDGLDNYEDCAEIAVAEGTGATAQEAVQALLAGLPEAFKALAVEGALLDAELQKDWDEGRWAGDIPPRPSVEGEIAQMIDTVLGGDWKPEQVSMIKALPDVEGMYPRRWSLFVHNTEDPYALRGHWFPCDNEAEVPEVQGLLAA